jgi:hypothetical protein
MDNSGWIVAICDNCRGMYKFVDMTGHQVTYSNTEEYERNVIHKQAVSHDDLVALALTGAKVLHQDHCRECHQGGSQESQPSRVNRWHSPRCDSGNQCSCCSGPQGIVE